MTKSDRAPQWRSNTRTPRSFTLSPEHISFLTYRQKKTGARSLSHAMREMIEDEMAANAGWNEGCDHENK